MKKTTIMERNLLLWLPGALGFLAFIYGCQTIAREMSPGEMLYRAKCSSCHNIIEASRYEKEEWCLYIDEHGEKMTDEEKRMVLGYLAETD
ncbi:MAG: hypothetical protein FVQ85_06485 [Planctomycetes bacterium]|nr:hypothetical protein [Planctomycetota bacterium]